MYFTAALRIAGVTAFLFFHPFTAYSINALLDMADGPIYKHILKINPIKAQIVDKILDLWLYSVAVAFATVNFQPQQATILILLYLYRLIGQIVFFSTKNKRVFVYFPNIFENMFFFFTFLDLTSSSYLLKNTTFCWGSLFIVVITKVLHEISLKYRNETVFDDIALPLLKKVRNSRL